MVQLLVDPTLSGGSTPHEKAEGYFSSKQQQDATASSSKEEHAQRIKDLHMRPKTRGPRRGYSLTDYQGEQLAAYARYHHSSNAGSSSAIHHEASIPENAVLSSIPMTPSASMASTSSTLSSASSTKDQTIQVPRRPKMPPPRRSQSVTDKEPEPVAHHRLPVHMNILELPSELHYTLFDFLDPIDGVCLGLTHSRLYTIHRRKYGKVPLSSRYTGPNDMEWAWRGAGPLVRRGSNESTKTANSNSSSSESVNSIPTPTSATSTNSKPLDKLRVKGQVYCRKCGISRCELHRHIKDWMGSGYQYCEIRKMYGPPAGEEAKSYCYMSSPKNPHRCGRHGGKKM